MVELLLLHFVRYVHDYMKSLPSMLPIFTSKTARLFGSIKFAFIILGGGIDLRHVNKN